MVLLSLVSPMPGSPEAVLYLSVGEWPKLKATDLGTESSFYFLSHFFWYLLGKPFTTVLDLLYFSVYLLYLCMRAHTCTCGAVRG